MSRPLAVDPHWLASHDEPALEPQRPVIDAHHHLWDHAGWPYGLDEWLAELDSGHRVVATVFVQCRSYYRRDGPEALRPVGETGYAAACAERCAAGPPGTPLACAGIVAHADLRLGAAVRPVLLAHLEAGAGRMRGIRHSTAWDPDPVVANPELGTVAGLAADSNFRAGFAELAPLGLSYDAWVYHPQIDEIAALARAFPETSIILDHAGGPAGIGRHSDRAAVWSSWCRSMDALAACPNVTVKLGGLAMRINGSDFHCRPKPPDSAALAESFRPWVRGCIERFGADRCLFESNFPVDKASTGYRTLWNAFKRLAAEYPERDRGLLLAGTAARVYHLADPAAPSPSASACLSPLSDTLHPGITT
ncbi:MAG: amidohydrolase [Lautropia sp.]